MNILQSDGIYSIHEDDPIYIPLVGDFVRSIPAKEEEFSKAVKSGDRKLMLAQAHKQKGSFATYGFTVVAEHFAKIENVLRLETENNTYLENPVFNNLIEELWKLFAKMTSKN